MTIHSHGYVPQQDQADRRETEFQTFWENHRLLLDKQEEILSCPDYFFTPLSFAGCSWPYVGGGGPLCLGYLLLCWRSGLLVEPCPRCGGNAMVTFFGGSPLSGSCGWSGFCIDCQSKQSAKGSVHTLARSSLALHRHRHWCQGRLRLTLVAGVALRERFPQPECFRVTPTSLSYIL